MLVPLFTYLNTLDDRVVSKLPLWLPLTSDGFMVFLFLTHTAQPIKAPTTRKIHFYHGRRAGDRELIGC